MCNHINQSTLFVRSVAALFLGTGLLSGCSQSHQLGMEDNPQEILDRKLNDPQAELTPSESITLLHHCVGLGEQSAAPAAGETVSMFVGNTGAGRSTFLNALLGCQMKVEVDEFEAQRIVVDPDSDIAEVMPIGHHGSRSQTFLPQVVQAPNDPETAYCDCPGFGDTRGAEINIANAINIRKVLQQATGVKAIFLTEYSDLIGSRGSGIAAMKAMCQQMFGGGELGISNLRRYQNSVFLGITKAPLRTEIGRPFSIDSIRLRLNKSDSEIAQILANRVFLCDPLDRGSDNPDFWSLEQCRAEIAQSEAIPRQRATTLFQTALNDSDLTHLLNTARHLRAKIAGAATRVDVDALGQSWQLLQHLRVIEHPEIERLIHGEVFPTLDTIILKRVDDFKNSTITGNVNKARRQLDQLIIIKHNLSGAPIACDINDLEEQLGQV